MNDRITTHYVGLDVHKQSIVIAVAEAGRQPGHLVATVPNDFKALSKVLDRLGPRSAIRWCYEAGPTGYCLARALHEAGWPGEVIAPSMIPKKSGERIKTDRRDAINLAHAHRAGDLTAVHVPSPRTEAIRDLVRARADARKAELVARHQLSKFLLRHGRVYEGKTTWNQTHRAWIVRQEFKEPSHQYVLSDALAAVDLAGQRVRQTTERLRELVQGWEGGPLVRALQALRGVEFVTAVTIATEAGDFRRFPTAGDFMGYIGLIPTEHSSGLTRRQGPITRTGNAHLRHVLVEAAWHYRRMPRLSKALRERSVGISPQVCAIAWKAQKRLHQRLNRLIGRGKNPAEAVTATARELAGFVWAIAREEVLVVN